LSSAAQETVSLRIHTSPCTGAMSHRHHLIIRVGACFIQFVYVSHSKLGQGAYPSQNSIFIIVLAGFKKWKYIQKRDNVVYWKPKKKINDDLQLHPEYDYAGKSCSP